MKSPIQATAAAQAPEELQWGGERRRGKAKNEGKEGSLSLSVHMCRATGYILCLNYPFVLTTALEGKNYFYLHFTDEETGDQQQWLRNWSKDTELARGTSVLGTLS